MANLFGRQKMEDPGAPPSRDDERQRLTAIREQQKKGGRSTTMLTSGLAAPLPRAPETRAPRTVLTS